LALRFIRGVLPDGTAQPQAASNEKGHPDLSERPESHYARLGPARYYFFFFLAFFFFITASPPSILPWIELHDPCRRTLQRKRQLYGDSAVIPPRCQWKLSARVYDEAPCLP